MSGFKVQAREPVNCFTGSLKNVLVSNLLNSNYFGKVLSYNGQVIEATSLPGIVGSLCTICSQTGEEFYGELVGVGEFKVDILPYELNLDIRVGDKVLLTETQQEVGVGDALLGRVLDGLGNPLDGLGKIKLSDKKSLNGSRVNPFQRQPIKEVLDVGIRNINALLTLGRGQRVGIVAGSGVGKSVLLSMITKSTDADVVVVSLIGERGRELASFTQEILSSHSRDKVVIVAVPADRSPLLRIQGAKRATTIAEYFRDKGKNVLLITDSLTRVAHAQRELGLALGEQPTSRGYPPSVISMIPNLIERTGTSTNNSGSITSIYTILADGDDTTTDPVVDTARAILDGHIVLSRELAQQGIYPAIDVNQSISRLMTDIVSTPHQKNAQMLRKYLSKYNENRDLVLMGGYVQGQDHDLDQALALWPEILKFLQQSENEICDFDRSHDQLAKLLGA
ncbi:FliI/YscN family ATPase [Paracoccaceae bacterium]|jgi:flagellum-specific ATP synthase|nr:FliI/YscN family ATPase [Paracoccaceae bacterium]